MGVVKNSQFSLQHLSLYKKRIYVCQLFGFWIDNNDFRATKFGINLQNFVVFELMHRNFLVNVVLIDLLDLASGWFRFSLHSLLADIVIVFMIEV